MVRIAALLISLTFAATGRAEHGKLIFEDDFERTESQEKKDEPGNGWKTNSSRRAKGDKQVDLKDGAMHIFISPKADHGVSVTHEAEFKDGTVAMRFMLEDEKDSLGLNFADLQCKEVWAGHLFVVKVFPTQVVFQDLKTGMMDLEIRNAKKGAGLSKEQKKMLEEKQKKLPLSLETGTWHQLLVQVKGRELQLSVNGKDVGRFASEGIEHPTKRMLRLAVPRHAVVDEVKIWSRE